MQLRRTFKTILLILLVFSFTLTACSGEITLSSSSDGGSGGEENGGLDAEIGLGESDSSESSNGTSQSNQGTRSISNQTLFIILAAGAILALFLILSRRSI